MKTTLHIRWDGDIPGVSQHRLSLSTWLEPLQFLLKGVKRTASLIATDALDDSERGLRGGRYAKAAEHIDLEIASIRDGCVQVDFVVTGGEPDEQLGLFPHLPADLPALAVAKILDDIEHESHGRMRNALIRRYLQALPSSISHHSYELMQDGKRVRRVDVDVRETKLPEAPAELPGLRRVHGRVLGVSFEPLAVTLKSDSAKLTCMATQAQVDDAIRWHAGNVVAMCVIGDKARLLWLCPEERAPGAPDGEERKARFVADWPRTLEILSR
jgi:hypothetical protein